MNDEMLVGPRDWRIWKRRMILRFADSVVT